MGLRGRFDRRSTLGLRRPTLRWCVLVVATAAVCGLPVRATHAVELPVVAANVDLVTTIPSSAPAISAAIDANRPYMYVSTVHGLDVYDIRAAESPVRVGTVPMVLYQNENVSMGMAAARRDGRSFVLMGTDYVGSVTPTDPGRSDVRPDDAIYINHIYVIDVTDPRAPFVRSDLPDVQTNTHTVSCLTRECRYAYTAGSNTYFSVIDLRDLDAPKEVELVRNPWKWHDWQVDAAGVMWQTADEGTAAFDIRDPLQPKVLNSTNKLALSGRGWNAFIHHNSARPYAKRFPMGSGARRGKPSVFRGDVVLVTEELNQTGPCSETTFQTWHVPSLRRGDTKEGKPGAGTIRPLDRWGSDVLGTGRETFAGSDCSAHYFDFHQSGFVVQGWYSSGVRVLDVRDAANIKQVGFFATPDARTWSAYWVPARDRRGRVVMGPQGEAARTNLVYTTDFNRGIDVLRVRLPSTSPKATRQTPSPDLSDWPQTKEVASLPGFACRVS